MSSKALTRSRAQAQTGSMAARIAARIAETTTDGNELVDFALRVFRDQTMPFEDRRWAMEWLADRGAGKAMATIEIGGHVSVGGPRMNLADYTLEELDEMEAIQRRATERKRIAQATDANVQKVIDVPPPSTP